MSDLLEGNYYDSWKLATPNNYDVDCDCGECEECIENDCNNIKTTGDINE